MSTFICRNNKKVQPKLRRTEKKTEWRDSNQEFADLKGQERVGIHTLGQELFTVVIQLALQCARVVVVKKCFLREP